MNNPSTSKHPRGLYLLFLTEMWERFSYYGMRAIFVLYMIKALMFDKVLASNIYGSYTGLVYLTPLLGGYLSDRYFGNRRSILTGGILMAMGQFLLFGSGMFYENVSMALPFFYTGLTFLIFGNGFFKPNISTMVGQLYPAGDKRVDSAFTIFYMGINLGAFFSPLVCGGLGDTGNPADFKWGFLAAGAGMVISVITFELFKNKYLVTADGKPVGMPPKPTSKRTATLQVPGYMVFWSLGIVLFFLAFYFLFHLDIIGALIFSSMIAIPGMIISDKSLTKIEKERIWVIFILSFFVIFFWSAFEQAGASLTFFAEEQTDRELFGWTIPASYFQSINPVAIIIFAPIFTLIWGALGKRNMEPSSPLKMSFGLLLLSLGYVVIAFGINGVNPGMKVSILWLTTMYLLHTFGELSLSPIGLSMVSKLAPVKFLSLLMGIWFLATAAANKLAGTLSSLYPPGEVEFKKATELGVDLPGILSGAATATEEQLSILVENEIPSKFPLLLGYQITNLFDFFMIFIVMSAMASLILFFLHKWLVKIMHGVK